MPFKQTSISFFFIALFTVACSSSSISSETNSHSTQSNQVEQKTTASKNSFTLEHIYIPPLITESTAPLLILMHGYGDNESSFANLAKSLNKGFHIAAVRAPHTLRENSFSWYGLKWANGKVVGHNEIEEVEAYQKVLQFVSEIKTEYKIYNRPVYLAGFSQGAMMALNLTLQNPNVFKGSAVLSGSTCDAARANFADKSELENHSFFVTHGVTDKIISIEEGKKTKELLEKFPSNLTYKEYQNGHTLSPLLIADLNEWLKELNNVN